MYNVIYVGTGGKERLEFHFRNKHFYGRYPSMLFFRVL